MVLGEDIMREVSFIDNSEWIKGLSNIECCVECCFCKRYIEKTPNCEITLSSDICDEDGKHYERNQIS